MCLVSPLSYCLRWKYGYFLHNHILLSLGDGLGEGYGMLGQAGSGKLRVSAAQSKLAAKVAKKYAFDSFCSMFFFVFTY
jgi:hypothetical protein